MIKTTVHQIKVILLLLLDLLYRSKKYFEYLITGKHEFQRICEDSQCDIYEKTMRIDRWLKRTKLGPLRTFLNKNLKTSKELDRLVKMLEQEVGLPKLKAKKGTRNNSNSHYLERLDNIEDVDSRLSDLLEELIKDFSKTIQRIKRTKLTADCKAVLEACLYRIICYQLSLTVAERIAAIKYDSKNSLHSDKLVALWNNLIKSDQNSADHTQPSSMSSSAFPEILQYEITEKSSLVSNRWSHIGFQGEDPGTDFRGMGLLGLVQLEYLSRRSRCLASDLLKRSLNDSHSYPFAIVGINLTYNLLSLLRDESLKHLYYDTGDVAFQGIGSLHGGRSERRRRLNLMKMLNDLYVELYLRFDCFWHESKPENIFAFRELMENFISIIRYDLCNRNFRFKFIY